MACKAEVPIFEAHSEQAFKDHVSFRREPAILRGANVGECVKVWSPEYLARKVGNLPVKIHVSPTPKMDFIRKNFMYKTLPFDELVTRASRKEQDCYFIHPQELYYLRSLGIEPRGTDIAHFSKHYPTISDDFKLPNVFDESKYFSSVLRVSSSGLSLWTHYDVMDNVLVQVRGKKTAILFNPNDSLNLYLVGDKSQIIDVDDVDNPQFPRFKKAIRYECQLLPGDILFIPALWLHNVRPLDFSVAVNVFWKNLGPDFYDKKDIYGNKDVIPAARALQTLQNATKLLSSLPAEYKDFYYRRMISELENKLDSVVKSESES
ncbi:tRNA wybutosine-synthesizing protein 5-like [Ischnura elegans]|uniref:tRNA wybutosine-synthesizing protein 5-like n=1 Tax=Ischnura elegans TaxID=197161 RepID=UPI001ED873B8|nr:tRNA wybutosine-synthesizing protein 5-like [Ischnura elegans]